MGRNYPSIHSNLPVLDHSLQSTPRQRSETSPCGIIQSSTHDRWSLVHIGRNTGTRPETTIKRQ